MSNHSQPANSCGIFPRPPFQLRSLPINIRWEVTRRHPYYVQFWTTGRKHYRQEPIDHPAELPLRQSVVMILASIGVSATPPDPKLDFKQLDADQLKPAWLSGAVHPISLRGLVGILLTALPKETLGKIGVKMIEASCEDKEGELPRRITALTELVALESTGLDDFADEPIVSVNPAASGRQISKAVSELIKDWKVERGLSEKRDRSDKHEDYLQVWDLREGWLNGEYDRSQERTLLEIAQQRKESPTTIHNHYCRAFELITGQSYSPEMWVRIVGPMKLNDFFGREIGPVSRKRPLKSPDRKDVPDTQLKGAIEESGITSEKPDNSTTNEMLLLVEDIRELANLGHSDREIAETLGFNVKSIEAITYLRNREFELP